MIAPRAPVLAAPPSVHGGPSGAEDERSEVRIDFSASINAWGPAPPVRDAALAAPIDTYPDPLALAPRRAAAAAWGRPLEEIAFGAGAAELLHAICFAFLRPGDTVLIPGPTFGEYARAAALCGARILQGKAAAAPFRMDLSVVARVIAQKRPRIVFLCAPNNPTGQSFPRDAVAEVADTCMGAGALLVLDQAYDAFAARPLGTPALPGHRAVLHLRSITKDHALAGLRAGFAIGPEPVIEAVNAARVPWAASAAAQAAAVAALSAEGTAHLAATIPRLRAERERIAAALARMGIAAVPSDTHFCLADVRSARATRLRLLADHGIKVRDCSSFDLPRHIRVAARTPEENDSLLAALEAVCST